MIGQRQPVPGHDGFHYGEAIWRGAERHIDVYETATGRHVATVRGLADADLHKAAAFAIQTRIEDGDFAGDVAALAAGLGVADVDTGITAPATEYRARDGRCSGPPKQDADELVGWMLEHGLITRDRRGDLRLREGGRIVNMALTKIGAASAQQRGG